MFKVGDEVVCVDAMDAQGYGPLRGDLRVGETYTVDGIYPCAHISLKEIQQLETGKIRCSCGTDRTHYFSWRFVKLPREKVDRPEAMPIEVGVE